MPLALSTGLALPAALLGDSPTDNDGDSPTDNDQEPSTLPDGLLAYYELDEASGQRNDSHTNVLHLSDTNSVGSAAGVGGVGTAAAFVAASNEFLSRADNAAFRVGSNIRAFAGWVYVDSLASTRGFLGKGGTGLGGEYTLDSSAGGQVRWQRRDPDNAATTFSVPYGTNITTGVWHFAVFGYAGNTGFLRLNNGTQVTRVWTGGTNAAANAFVLGNLGTGASDLEGRIQCLGIWERLLTQQELDFLYNSGASARSYADLASFSPLEGFEAAYSWWNDPPVRHGTNTYIGATDEQGVRKIARWPDGASKPDLLVPVLIQERDDHDSVSLSGPLSDGRWCHCYQRHNLDTTLRHRMTLDSDPMNVGDEVQITASGTVTYCQTQVHGDKLFRFHRVANTDWICVFTLDTTDLAPTFDTITLVENSLNSDQIYCKTQRLSNDICRVFVYRHPTSSENEIRSFDIDLTDGLVFSGSTEYGYLDGSAGAGAATLPADFDELPEAYAPGADTSLRMLDVSPDALKVAIAEWPTADNSNPDYYILKFTSGVPGSATKVSLTEAGAPFYDASTYVGGVSFARESHSGLRVYVSREASGTWYIERWDSASGNGGDWVTTVLSQSASQLLLRPLPIINPHASMPLIWQEVDSYTDFDTFEGMRAVGA